MIGLKIKELRKQLGISQQQLAGKELTRAFISMVEAGKCSPSPATLRLIAQRLGKTVDYFQGAEQPSDSLSTILSTLERASAELDEPLPRLVAMEGALREAIIRSHQLDRVELEAAARCLLLRCLGRQERYEWVLTESDAAITTAKAAGEQEQLASAYRTVGAAAYTLERFTIAKSSFEQAALIYSVHKRYQRERIETLTALGETLFRLGQLKEAATQYHEALAECSRTSDPERWGRLALGLGRVKHAAGETASAAEWTERAVEAISGRPEGVVARHHLGRILAEQGDWERAFAIFTACYKEYRAQCALSSQAATLEDLALYWIQKGDLSQAEALAWRALEMLDSMESLVVRGRLCRLLGSIAAQRGSRQEASSLLRLSIALLKSVKAHAEVELSTRALYELMTQEPH